MLEPQTNPQEPATPDALATDPQDTEATETAKGNTLTELIETIVFIVLVFFIVRGVVQNFRIEGESMSSTLHDKQYILVNKVIFFHFDSHAPLRLLPGYSNLAPREVYPFRIPQRGEIVVLEAPTTDYDGQRDYIKRVIGLPGETVQIKDGKVFINGNELDEPYLTQSTDCSGAGGPNPGLCDPYLVPPNSVVVMGDNRGNSQDSRSWNAPPGLPLDRIVGKAWISYWPQSDWGIIPAPAYAIPSP